jgi:hypothetical protein
MRHLQYIPSFYFYKFANAVAAPYTSLSAYQNGVIDENGNLMSTEGSLDDFEYFVIKLKKIFEDLPPGLTKSRLTNVSSIMQLFSEGVENIGVTQEQVLSLIEAHVTINSNNKVSLLELLEDMGTGAMSTGTKAGEIGVPAEAPEANKGNISGYDPRLGEILTRNQPVNMFANVEMFNVPSQEFKAFKQSKAWRHLPDSLTKKYLQRFQRRNKEGKMAVRDESSGEIFFVPYKEKSFMEEFGLEYLDILNEQNKPATERFKDSPTDPNRNVAVLDNDQEEKLGSAEPVEASPKELKTTAEIYLQQFGREVGAQEARRRKSAETKAAETGRPSPQFKGVRERKTHPMLGGQAAERYAGAVRFAQSFPAIERVLKSMGSQGEEIAARAHGMMRHLATRSGSSQMPYDIAGFRYDEDPETGLAIPHLGFEDVKALSARNPTGMDIEEFEDVEGGMPKISGQPAYQAQTAAKKAGDYTEAQRIEREVIAPWFGKEKVQERARNIWTRKMKEKMGQSGVSMVAASKPGENLVPLDDVGLDALAKQGMMYRHASSRENYYPLMQTLYSVGKLVKGKRSPLVLPERTPLMSQRDTERVARGLRLPGY